MYIRHIVNPLYSTVMRILYCVPIYTAGQDSGCFFFFTFLNQQ